MTSRVLQRTSESWIVSRRDWDGVLSKLFASKHPDGIVDSVNLSSRTAMSTNGWFVFRHYISSCVDNHYQFMQHHLMRWLFVRWEGFRYLQVLNV